MAKSSEVTIALVSNNEVVVIIPAIGDDPSDEPRRLVWSQKGGWKDSSPTREYLGYYLDELVVVCKELDKAGVQKVLVDAVEFDFERTTWDNAWDSNNRDCWSEKPQFPVEIRRE